MIEIMRAPLLVLVRGESKRKEGRRWVWRRVCMAHLCEREPNTCHHTRVLRCLRQVAGKQVGSQRVPPLCYH